MPSTRPGTPLHPDRQSPGKRSPDSRWESFAVELATRQGYPLAAGGICRRGTAVFWKERFCALASIRLAGDAYSIDYTLARALRDLADDSLPVAGCSVKAAGLVLPPGVRTGGVLGCPWRPPASAENGSERLPGGFSLHADAGGPGLAALAEPEETERAFLAARALGDRVPVTAIAECLFSHGLVTFLFVADGTGPAGVGPGKISPGKIGPGKIGTGKIGPDARGCVIAANQGAVAAITLE